MRSGPRLSFDAAGTAQSKLAIGTNRNRNLEVPLPKIFIYKIFCALTRARADTTLTYKLSSRTCLGAMLFQRSGEQRRSGWQTEQCCRKFVDTISIIGIYVHPDLDSTNYEDKGAPGFQPVPASPS